MKLQCIVIEDKLESWPAKGTNPAGEARRLLVMDRDSTPLASLLAITVPMSCPLSGDIKQGASLAGKAVTLGVSDIRQNDKTKQLSGRGQVVSLDGAWAVTPEKKAA